MATGTSSLVEAIGSYKISLRLVNAPSCTMAFPSLPSQLFYRKMSVMSLAVFRG